MQALEDFNLSKNLKVRNIYESELVWRNLKTKWDKKIQHMSTTATKRHIDGEWW